MERTKNVILRHNHLNPISTKLTSIDIVFLEGKEYTKLVEILNEELNKTTIWLYANKLKMINVKKNALHGLPPRKN